MAQAATDGQSEQQRTHAQQWPHACATDRSACSIHQETLDEQIAHLFEEVLHEAQVPEPERQRVGPNEEDQRVVVTGLGLITPLGVGVAPFWAGLTAGASAIAPVTHCDVQGLPCRIAGEVRDFDPHAFMERREARRMGRGSQFAVAAAWLALHDAHLIVNEDNCDDVGTLLACAATSYPETEEAMGTLLTGDARHVSPFYLMAALPAMPACQVAIHLGLRGHISAISTAGAASTQAIGEAAAIIRRGDAAVMLAGGAEAPISRTALASFGAMRALSQRNEDPARASRPFDALRDGFVLGEGAAVLVLERLSYARQRGATIYAEVAGYASSCDVYHPVLPDPHGSGAARALRLALLRAGLQPHQIDYISAHAAGTRAGDVAETLAIKHVFETDAANVPISAPKSMIGHLAGAAGAVEAAAAILALKHGMLPPTINQEYPDPDCDLDYVPNAARPAAVQRAISHAAGFGGVNAALVWKRSGAHDDEYHAQRAANDSEQSSSDAPDELGPHRP